MRNPDAVPINENPALEQHYAEERDRLENNFIGKFDPRDTADDLDAIKKFAAEKAHKLTGNPEDERARIALSAEVKVAIWLKMYLREEDITKREELLEKLAREELVTLVDAGTSFPKTKTDAASGFHWLKSACEYLCRARFPEDYDRQVYGERQRTVEEEKRFRKTKDMLAKTEIKG